MTDGVEARVIGLGGINATFSALKSDIRYKGARYALRRGALLVRDAAVRNAQRVNDPQTPEDISKNITIRFSTSTFRRTGDVLFRVGVLGGARAYANTRANVRKGRAGAAYKTEGDKTNPGGDTWYWRMVEFGTENMPANPFMRRALSENAEAATDETAKQLNTWLDRYFRRLKR